MEHSVEALDRNYDGAAADNVQPMFACWKADTERWLRSTGKYGISAHPDEFEHV
jgi:hypothetical protein